MKFNNRTCFDGDDYEHKRDFERLSGQILDIYLSIMDGQWYSLAEIEKDTGHPQASISAQLRNMRKARFGGLTILTQHVSSGFYRYRIDLSAPRKEPEKALKVNHTGIEKFLRDLKNDIDKTGLTIISKRGLDYNLICKLLGDS